MKSVKKMFGKDDQKDDTADHNPNDLQGTGTDSGHAYSSGKEESAHRQNDELAHGETPLNKEGSRGATEGYNTEDNREIGDNEGHHEGKGEFNKGLDSVGSKRGLVGDHVQEAHPSGERPVVDVETDETVHANNSAMDHIKRTHHEPEGESGVIGGERRDEKTGLGRRSQSTSGSGFDQPHSEGHRHGSEHFDPKLATHDHQHLQHVTHRDVRHVEVEEVERTREVDRHVHHVQTHIQPVVDKQVMPEKIRENLIAPTEIKEKHSSSKEDVELFASLATQHKDTEVHRGKERTVVDLGERVHENVHHHVHHVTQPVIEQEVVERHRIHTVIPVHHVTHEAPIIHKSSTHAPVSIDDFVQGGGKLDSKITHETSGLLANENCERTSDGPAEKMMKDLHLESSHHDRAHGEHFDRSHGEHLSREESTRHETKTDRL